MSLSMKLIGAYYCSLHYWDTSSYIHDSLLFLVNLTADQKADAYWIMLQFTSSAARNQN